jgi:cyclohexanone monooxygenase
VDVKHTPIEVTPTGIKTGETKHPLDALVLATGYDAVTGAMMRVDITGRDGVKLRDHWGEGPRTHLGLTTAGFPNLFFVDGPGSPGAFFQPILLAEHQVRWVGEAASFVRNRNARTIEPSAAAEAEWTGHLTDVTNATLFPKANSWYMGANIPGKPRVPMMYLGGFGEYSRRTNLAVTSEFSEFLVSHTAVEQEACSELVDQQA